MNKTAQITLSDVIYIQLNSPSQEALAIITKLQDLNGVRLLALDATHIKVFLPFYALKENLAIEITQLLSKRLSDIGLLTQLSTESYLAQYGK